MEKLNVYITILKSHVVPYLGVELERLQGNFYNIFVHTVLSYIQMKPNRNVQRYTTGKAAKVESFLTWESGQNKGLFTLRFHGNIAS